MFDSSEPISAPLRNLLIIFSEQLPDIRFGDIDKAILEDAAARVEAAAQKNDAAEAALDAARADLAATQQALLVTGQRALAYARIYAETSPELFSRLQALCLTNGPTNVIKTREVETKLGRRRTRKDAGDDMPALPGTVAEEPVLSVSPS